MVELRLLLGIFTFHAVYPVIEALSLDYVVGCSAILFPYRVFNPTAAGSDVTCTVSRYSLFHVFAS